MIIHTDFTTLETWQKFIPVQLSYFAAVTPVQTYAGTNMVMLHKEISQIGTLEVIWDPLRDYIHTSFSYRPSNGS